MVAGCQSTADLAVSLRNSAGGPGVPAQTPPRRLNFSLQKAPVNFRQPSAIRSFAGVRRGGMIN